MPDPLIFLAVVLAALYVRWRHGPPPSHPMHPPRPR